jgi:uncharacterized secreted protein with C-terminal beta-propeller domain
MLLTMAMLTSACITTNSQGGQGQARPAAVRPVGIAAVADAVGLDLFDSCDEVLSYLQTQALDQVTAWGLGNSGWMGRAMTTMEAVDADAAAPSAENHSTTNVQEAGVDEPDLVKTDGKRIVALAQGKLHLVEVEEGKSRLVGSVAIDQNWGHQLLFHNDTVLVIGTAGANVFPLADSTDMAMPDMWWQPDTVLTEVDISDPANPTVVRRMTIQGSMIAARLTEGVARLVITTQPRNIPFITPDVLSQRQPVGPPGANVDWNRLERMAEANNRQLIIDSTIDQWFPRYRLEQISGPVSEKEGVLANCGRMAHPEQPSGLALSSIVSIDLSRGLQVTDTFGLVSDAGTVYASPDAIYIATQQWVDWQAIPENQWEEEVQTVTTTIHRFDASAPNSVTFTGSGEVPGWLYSQWAMSEHQGRLRVASTTQSPWWGWRQSSESMVTVLEPGDGNLTTVGQVSGLGLGEQIYAVRFIGETGYVVTFRQTDPLYTIDLSNPSLPVVAGELKIPGYSAYLHPIGEGLLLGVGQDADLNGRVKGTQVAVFDVSDPAQPRQIDKLVLPGAYSEAEWDHHAFLYWQPTATAVLPMQQTRGNHWWSGALAVQASGEGVWMVGEITQPSGYVQRSLVIGELLFTYSDTGIQVNELQSLDEVAWLPF